MSTASLGLASVFFTTVPPEKPCQYTLKINSDGMNSLLVLHYNGKASSVSVFDSVCWGFVMLRRFPSIPALLRV